MLKAKAFLGILAVMVLAVGVGLTVPEPYPDSLTNAYFVTDCPPATWTDGWVPKSLADEFVGDDCLVLRDGVWERAILDRTVTSRKSMNEVWLVQSGPGCQCP